MPLSARRHIRRMRGGAQAHLIQADDERYYVVKFQNNPQHRRILVNELVSSVFLRYLDVATPETALIEITQQFLDENPGLHFTLGTQRIAVRPGWHFGSRHPGDPDRLNIYDFVPDVLLDQIDNRHDFLAVLVFDKWAANADARQCVFYRAMLQDWAPGSSEPRTRPGFVTRMIDHGFVFNGPHWEFTDSPLQGLYSRRKVYEQVRSLDDFEPWLSRVMHFPETVVDQAWRQVPPEWVEGEEDALERLLEALLERRRRVPDLIRDLRNSRFQPFPHWT